MNRRETRILTENQSLQAAKPVGKHCLISLHAIGSATVETIFASYKVKTEQLYKNAL
ncbi:MAG: hypothetical protein J07HQX50_02088 [Haloquadratum sp. J07HQX50]|nr:MAG: hypothetical protein J07HQX50_02088 [Haloquadratum sp. J07HQX50]